MTAFRLPLAWVIDTMVLYTPKSLSWHVTVTVFDDGATQPATPRCRFRALSSSCRKSNKQKRHNAPSCDRVMQRGLNGHYCVIHLSTKHHRIFPLHIGPMFASFNPTQFLKRSCGRGMLMRRNFHSLRVIIGNCSLAGSRCIQRGYRSSILGAT